MWQFLFLTLCHAESEVGLRGGYVVGGPVTTPYYKKFERGRCTGHVCSYIFDWTECKNTLFELKLNHVVSLAETYEAPNELTGCFVQTDTDGSRSLRLNTGGSYRKYASKIHQQICRCRKHVKCRVDSDCTSGAYCEKSEGECWTKGNTELYHAEASVGKELADTELALGRIKRRRPENWETKLPRCKKENEACHQKCKLPGAHAACHYNCRVADSICRTGRQLGGDWQKETCKRGRGNPNYTRMKCAFDKPNIGYTECTAVRGCCWDDSIRGLPSCFLTEDQINKNHVVYYWAEQDVGGEADGNTGIQDTIKLIAFCGLFVGAGFATAHFMKKRNNNFSYEKMTEMA